MTFMEGTFSTREWDLTWGKEVQVQNSKMAPLDFHETGIPDVHTWNAFFSCYSLTNLYQ